MRKILAIAVFALLSACQNMDGLGIGGNEKFDPAWIKQHVVIGKTTQHDIYSMYGEPDSKSTDANNSDTWVYEKNQSGNNLLSMASGMIPGMSTVKQAKNVADVHDKKGYGNGLFFWFKNGTLTNWHN
ncbi:hypothetical protein GIY62_25955 [Burkholderia plantarii]|uniref:hypothetical protein n=1 Tax=Burkholderia plantarii TaxID=41899 RepID=UPI00272C0286|nr:hypothetical protein [Burkholderia plantarii]WLE63710.1 hypothetical protein GIY62_25955 [Burkholderia plantarii]